ncbi:MAG: hypothetical protein Q8M94_05265 [Ignavibacteria bacterium]|nr:hypothetical protein [Ignavibacteria bacterium]
MEEMMEKRKIRNLGKRFEIVLFHLGKIIEDWGECQGLSGNDVTELSVIKKTIKRLYEQRKPFTGYRQDIDECEYN